MKNKALLICSLEKSIYIFLFHIKYKKIMSKKNRKNQVKKIIIYIETIR